MSDFTNEMIEHLRKKINENYKKRKEIIKQLEAEYKKNALFIYKEIVQKSLVQEIYIIANNTDIPPIISTKIEYKDNDKAMYDMEQKRLEELTVEEWCYLRENHNIAFTTIMFYPDENKESYEIYGTDLKKDDKDSRVNICFDKNELERLIEKDDLKFDDNYSNIIVSMVIPDLEKLLTKSNNMENKKLKIYKRY